MSMPERALAALLLAACTAPAMAQLSIDARPELGAPAHASTVEKWNATVFADGTGLPHGSGSVAAGRELYANLCSGCHGASGEGALAEELAGGEGSLTDRYPDKTIGLYWPYATTLFDVIRRSMPMHAPGSLSDDQTYALTAFVLHLNNLLADDAVLDKNSLAAIEMPNRHGFDQIYQLAD